MLGLCRVDAVRSVQRRDEPLRRITGRKPARIAVAASMCLRSQSPNSVAACFFAHGASRAMYGLSEKNVPSAG